VNEFLNLPFLFADIGLRELGFANSRVNRVATVFKDKPSGLIVDYIGIGDKLRDATKKYTSAGGKGNVAIDIDEAFELALEVIANLKQHLPEDTIAPAHAHNHRLTLKVFGTGVIMLQDIQSNFFNPVFRACCIFHCGPKNFVPVVFGYISCYFFCFFLDLSVS